MSIFLTFVAIGLLVIWAAYFLLSSVDIAERRKNKLLVVFAWAVIIIFALGGAAFIVRRLLFLQWGR